MIKKMKKRVNIVKPCSTPPREGRWGGAKCQFTTQTMNGPGSNPGGVRFWDVCVADVRRSGTFLGSLLLMPEVWVNYGGHQTITPRV